MAARRSPGIRERHGRACRSRDGGRCSCSPSWEAAVYSAAEGRRLYRTFTSHAAARSWVTDTRKAFKDGRRRVDAGRRLREAAAALLEGVAGGVIRDRSGDPYKPATVRDYERMLRNYLLPAIGTVRLGSVERGDVQALVDDWLRSGASASSVRNRLMPLRVIYRLALQDGEVATSPCEHLRLPAVRSRRDRVVGPTEARDLLAALPLDIRALYATATYAGLRRGELRALRWTDVDLAAAVIRVRRSADDKAGEQEPKTRAGRRDVPIIGALQGVLAEWRSTRRGSGLVFPGRTPEVPFTPSNVYRKARAAWRRAGLEGIVPHEGRHSAVTLMIAAGANALVVKTVVGHASIDTTYDLYGHLLAGEESSLRTLVDAFVRDDLGERPAPAD